MKISDAPLSKDSVLSCEDLCNALQPLIGQHFTLTGTPRTYGSKLRKLVISRLLPLTPKTSSSYKKIPPKGKGVPRLLAQLIDTYIVTSGDNYNLQVWNRIPNSSQPLIIYDDGQSITPQDIRYVLIKVNNNIIESIIILTPEYIEDNFGKFGTPTIKSQLLISDSERKNIINSSDKILFYDDTDNIKRLVAPSYKQPISLSTDKATKGNVISLIDIKEKVAKKLLGKVLNVSDTKTRGQSLERQVIQLLGYDGKSQLVGGYPDVPNQLLEVKVQDAQTVDLGKYSPQFEEIIDNELNISTFDIRYLIALTDPNTNTIQGVILSSGKHLGDKFTYVSSTSYKCQRNIRASFFEKYKNQCVFNPIQKPSQPKD